MIAIARSSEYAIRALTYLARHHGEGFCLARSMAEDLGIPAPFLVKCLQPLVVRGLLVSQRGRKGGFQLAGEPEDVTLYQIVDALEHLDRPRQCFLGQAECTDERACPMHEFWKQASGEFEQTLLTTRLSQLVSFCEENPDGGYPAQLEPDARRD